MLSSITPSPWPPSLPQAATSQARDTAVHAQPIKPFERNEFDLIISRFRSSFRLAPRPR